MKKFLIASVFAVLSFGAAAHGSVSIGVYGPGYTAQYSQGYQGYRPDVRPVYPQGQYAPVVPPYHYLNQPRYYVAPQPVYVEPPRCYNTYDAYGRPVVFCR